MLVNVPSTCNECIFSIQTIIYGLWSLPFSSFCLLRQCWISVLFEISSENIYFNGARWCGASSRVPSPESVFSHWEHVLERSVRDSDGGMWPAELQKASGWFCTVLLAGDLPCRSPSPLPSRHFLPPARRLWGKRGIAQLWGVWTKRWWQEKVVWKEHRAHQHPCQPKSHEPCRETPLATGAGWCSQASGGSQSLGWEGIQGYRDGMGALGRLVPGTAAPQQVLLTQLTSFRVVPFTFQSIP